MSFRVLTYSRERPISPGDIVRVRTHSPDVHYEVVRIDPEWAQLRRETHVSWGKDFHAGVHNYSCLTHRIELVE